MKKTKQCDHKLKEIFEGVNLFMLSCSNHGKLGVFQEIEQDDIEDFCICYENIYQQDGKYYEFLLTAEEFYMKYN